MEDHNRLQLHLMPPQGWMNDPNGLCQFQGQYHVFYQYSPEDAMGAAKLWGHYVSDDLLHWRSMKPALYPDIDEDRSGVFSGSAYMEHDRMYLYYTGHVAWPKKYEGQYDDVYQGFDENTILVTSEDGEHFSSKQVLLTNRDYPKGYSQHVRDPKVWREQDCYYMIQGARRRSNVQMEDRSIQSVDPAEDQGTVLIFKSDNLVDWTCTQELTTPRFFGYMWECPDYFVLNGQKILSVSPQGLESEPYRFQNRYESGYFLLDASVIETPSRQPAGQRLGDISHRLDIDATRFREWDMGFDFYAPQTFLDDKGRRVLIGWVGNPDAAYDNQPTIDQGWQHALSIPRELIWKNNQVYQLPVEEMQRLRYDSIQSTDGVYEIASGQAVELRVDHIQSDIQFVLTDDMHIDMRKEAIDGTQPPEDTLLESDWVQLRYTDQVLELSLSSQAGRGRSVRRARLEKLTQLQIYIDTSMLEIYVNGGELVMTTRYYLGDATRRLTLEGVENSKLWKLDGLMIQ